MNSTIDKNLLVLFDSIKGNDEKILWIGKPRLIPFLWPGIINILFYLMLGGAWYLFIANVKTDNGESNYLLVFVGLIILVKELYAFSNRLLSYRNTFYCYSDKRIMMRSGIAGIDFKTIDHDKISETEVVVSAMDKVYSAGTIRFFSGQTETTDSSTTKLYDSWNAIPEPYKVYKHLKEVMIDIKTDFNYPNAMRPDNNPGYRTTYAPAK